MSVPRQANICRFYANGYCRYGNNCRFYHAQPQSQHPTVAATSFFTDKNKSNWNITLESIVEDMKEWEQCSIWPLSSYGLGEKQCFPGFEDFSVEEFRYAFLLNKGTLPTDVVGKINSQAKYRQIYSSMSKDVQEIVLKIISGEQAATKPFGVNSSPAGFSPGSFVAQRSPNVQQSQSIFGGGPISSPPNPQSNSAPFGSSSGVAAASPIMNASTKPMGSPSTAPSIFGGAPFQSTTNPPPPQTNLLPPQTNLPPPQTNPPPQQVNLGTPSQLFTPSGDSNNSGGGQKPFSPEPTLPQYSAPNAPILEKGVYSNRADLSEKDIEAFSAPSFTLETIPLLPPSKDFC